MIAWDTETCLFRPGLQAPPPVCYSFAERIEDPGESDDGDIASDVLHHTDAEKYIIDWLTQPQVLANAPFDLAVVCAHYPHLMRQVFHALDQDRIHDVLLRQKLLDLARGRLAEFGYSLAELAKRFGLTELDKDTWRMKYALLRDTPISEWPEGAVEYARMDVVTTLEVYERQEEERAEFIEVFGLDPLEDQHRQNRAAFSLHLMACWGVRTDGPAIDAFEVLVKAEHVTIETQLVEAGLVKDDGVKNTKAVKARMLASVGVDDVKITATGLRKIKAGLMDRAEAVAAGYISCDEDACKGSGDDLLLKYSRITKLGGLLSTAIPLLHKGRTTPIHPSIDYLLTTGRISMSNPNMQNLRREPGVRECVVPRAGNVLIACDYDKAELHSLAQSLLEQFGSSKLADALNEGIDPHTDVAAGIMGIPYEEAVERRKNNDEEIEDLRQVCKAANFGFAGGAGAGAFQLYARNTYGLILTLRECEEAKAAWKEHWPEIADYHKWIGDMEHHGEFNIVQPMSNRIRGGCTFTQAANSFFQSRTGDAVKQAGWEIARAQYLDKTSPLYETRTMLVIHDEYLVEAPEHRAHEAAMELRDIMVRVYNLWTPDVPVGATPALMRRWSKKAKTTYVMVGDQKRLIPWEDAA